MTLEFCIKFTEVSVEISEERKACKPLLVLEQRVVLLLDCCKMFFVRPNISQSVEVLLSLAAPHCYPLVFHNTVNLFHEEVS